MARLPSPPYSATRSIEGTVATWPPCGRYGPGCAGSACGCRESRPWLWPGGLRSWPVSRDDFRSCACGSCSFWSRGSPRGCGCRGARRRGRKRNPDPGPSARCTAATAAGPGEASTGRTGPFSQPARRDTKITPPGPTATCQPGHTAALAPRHRPPSLGRPVRGRQDRPASDLPEHQGPSPLAGPREPRLGIPQDPRRNSRPRN